MGAGCIQPSQETNRVGRKPLCPVLFRTADETHGGSKQKTLTHLEVRYTYQTHNSPTQITQSRNPFRSRTGRWSNWLMVRLLQGGRGTWQRTHPEEIPRLGHQSRQGDWNPEGNEKGCLMAASNRQDGRKDRPCEEGDQEDHQDCYQEAQPAQA